MIETHGNLWQFPTADVVVITTNGFVKKNGECVMGRGCAKEARVMFPGLAAHLGKCIQKHGNIPFYFSIFTDKFFLATMPVKHVYSQPASLPLILSSARTLVNYADQNGWNRIIMPRPGCGNGQLSWDDVGPELAKVLDDRFAVTTF